MSFQFEMFQEAKEEAKARKNSAKDQLLKGMQTTVISEDNPGFKMMKMMGYKEGSGLGKEGTVEFIFHSSVDDLVKLLLLYVKSLTTQHSTPCHCATWMFLRK